MKIKVEQPQPGPCLRPPARSSRLGGRGQRGVCVQGEEAQGGRKGQRRGGEGTAQSPLAALIAQ